MSGGEYTFEGETINSICCDYILMAWQIAPKIETETPKLQKEVEEAQKTYSSDVKHQKDLEPKLEKAKEDGGWINAGFMVLEPQILDYITNDNCIFEKEPLEKLAVSGNLQAYKHTGFWQCMDTQRDRFLLESLWLDNTCPWRKW